MATEVYTTEEIRLLDEEEVELRPLPIAKLRKFMRMWTEHMADVTAKLKKAQKEAIAHDQALDAKAAGENVEVDEEFTPSFTEADLQDAQYDIFVKMCALGLSKDLQKDRSDRQFLAYLEDVLDESTIYRILKVTGGLEIGDEAPNPQTPESLAAELGQN